MSPRLQRVSLVAAAALALADASVVALALPQIIDQLHTSVDGAAAVIGVYTVVLAPALLVAARLDRGLGSARLGASALALFALGCLGCAVSGSLAVLLAFRAVQALGAAGALIAVFDRLGAARTDGGGRRLWTAAAVSGFAAGPAIGGVLTQAFDWRAIFVAQIPFALAAAYACLRIRTSAGAAPAEVRGERAALRPYVSLALVSAASSALLFLLVLVLVVGWSIAPIGAALTVTVLPLTALAAARAGGDPRLRATVGCTLVAGGVLCLGFLPHPSVLWTIVPQLLTGAGVGLALPAIAGELLPERNVDDAAWLLFARHVGIALALVLLAPIVTSSLASATGRARERGVALVLDSSLAPQSKLTLAPSLLAGVESARPRAGLRSALAANRGQFSGADLVAYDELGRRADETLVRAVSESFRTAFVISAVLALLGAAVLLPVRGARRLSVAFALSALVAAFYVAANSSDAPRPVVIANPCLPRKLPQAGGITGALQTQTLESLDRIACRDGSSREELVLALADSKDAAAFQRKHGVTPTLTGTLLQGLLGP